MTTFIHPTAPACTSSRLCRSHNTRRVLRAVCRITEAPAAAAVELLAEEAGRHHLLIKKKIKVLRADPGCYACGRSASGKSGDTGAVRNALAAPRLKSFHNSAWGFHFFLLCTSLL